MHHPRREGGKENQRKPNTKPENTAQTSVLNGMQMMNCVKQFRTRAFTYRPEKIKKQNANIEHELIPIGTNYRNMEHLILLDRPQILTT